MRPRRVLFCLLSVLAAISVSAAPAGKGEKQTELEATLQEIVKEYLTALEKEDVEAMEKAGHPDSKHFVQPLEQWKQLFPFFDLRHKLVVCSFLGGDKDCAVVRIMVTSSMARMEEIARLIKREPYKSRLRDSLFVFRKHADGWLLWQEVLLETKDMGE